MPRYGNLSNMNDQPGPRRSHDEEGDNEYGMVIGSVRGGSVSDVVSKGGQRLHKQSSPDKTSNWSALSEQTKRLVNL